MYVRQYVPILYDSNRSGALIDDVLTLTYVLYVLASVVAASLVGRGIKVRR